MRRIPIMSVWSSPRWSTTEQFRRRRREARGVAIAHPSPANESWGTGRMLMRGLWYGDRDPRQPKNFGKVEGFLGFRMGKVVGKRLSPYLIRRMKG